MKNISQTAKAREVLYHLITKYSKGCVLGLQPDDRKTFLLQKPLIKILALCPSWDNEDE